MLKEVGCGSTTPPPGDGGGGANGRQIGANEGGGGGGASRGGIRQPSSYMQYATTRALCFHLGECEWSGLIPCKIHLKREFAIHSQTHTCGNHIILFAVSRCSRCRAGISASELVMRARDLVYHVACFTCASCGTPLNKGDHFGQRDGLVYCRPHYELLCCAGDYGGAAGSIEDLGSPGVSPLPAYYEQSSITSGTVQKGRPRKRKLSEVTGSELPVTMRLAAGALADIAIAELLHPTELSSSMESLAAYDASVGSPGPVHQNQRTKRMRTSFKHHQLRTMKNYFAINQNPDAKDLKQLAQKTGLSKRVLQVWFQNARAKWRRNLMRQDSSNAGSNVGCSGTTVSSSTGNSPTVGPAASILGDSNSMPSTSMEELHALHHLHSGVSSQVSFSDLY
ncbi:LIM/homeobox protein Lhx2 [Trachymyrmex zeteki]|uniref:LIM/homeobox protein Lhx2 n=1 Tax=Mycetomoellerius zeteki TaxID=64791 RepID=A0A151WJY7_9HYME|nr:LIM/homeobox protein Lhx2 [Trachymyrmex zeteki]